MSAERDESLNAVLHSYLQAVDAGQSPARNDLLRRHPAFAAELVAFFAEQDRLDQLAQSMRGADAAAEPAAEGAPTLAPGQTAPPAAGTTVRYFGDYELLEEVARGGMGVV